MSECLFCNIVNKKNSTDIIYQDDSILVFNDIAPQAPIHFLLIPKQHIATINDTDDAYLIGKLAITATKIAKKLKIAKDGYRLVLNCNKNGGQAVYHIHMHFLAGRQLDWPPG